MYKLACKEALKLIYERRGTETFSLKEFPELEKIHYIFGYMQDQRLIKKTFAPTSAQRNRGRGCEYHITQLGVYVARGERRPRIRYSFSSWKKYQKPAEAKLS